MLIKYSIGDDDSDDDQLSGFCWAWPPGMAISHFCNFWVEINCHYRCMLPHYAVPTRLLLVSFYDMQENAAVLVYNSKQ